MQSPVYPQTLAAYLAATPNTQVVDCTATKLTGTLGSSRSVFYNKLDLQAIGAQPTAILKAFSVPEDCHVSEVSLRVVRPCSNQMGVITCGDDDNVRGWICGEYYRASGIIRPLPFICSDGWPKDRYHGGRWYPAARTVHLLLNTLGATDPGCIEVRAIVETMSAVVAGQPYGNGTANLLELSNLVQ